MSSNALRLDHGSLDVPGPDIRTKKILSGSAIKMIAVILMIVDHVTAYILGHLPVFINYIEVAGVKISWYMIIRHITRMGFPLFCFGIVEGYLHTHDRRKYGLNILVFAFLSEVPWDLVHYNKLFDTTKQNVFFTLFLGYLAICILEKYKDDMLKCTLLLLICTLVSFPMHADYGPKGFCFLVVMYVVRNNLALQALASGGMINEISHGAGALAAIPIALYNGERGFIKGKFWKYFFYCIYPGHLLAIWYALVRIGYFKI